MALQSSGAISFSQIAAEFGGAGSHSLSEYYPLVGLGVTGLSSSGTFSFSQFHGKSKVVTISVWVSSGYNSSTTNWQYRNQGTNNNWSQNYATRNNQWRYNVYFDGFNVITFTGGRTNWGIYDYSPYGSGGIKRSWVTTAWVDTSAYQNQNVNRQITT